MQLNDEHAYKLSSEDAKNPLASKGGRDEGRTHSLSHGLSGTVIQHCRQLLLSTITGQQQNGVAENSVHVLSYCQLHGSFQQVVLFRNTSAYLS